MTIGIVRVTWSGATGGPGLSQLAVGNPDRTTLATADALTAVNAVRSWFDAQKAYIPNEITLTVQPTLDLFNETDGALVGSVTSATAPASVAGTYTGSFAGAAGHKVTWETGQIAHRRRVRGATYVVPSGGHFDGSGLVNSTATTAINAANANLISALNTGGLRLMVYSRPRFAGTGTSKTLTRNGFATEVTLGRVTAKGAVLRGRRD